MCGSERGRMGEDGGDEERFISHQCRFLGILSGEERKNRIKDEV